MSAKLTASIHNQPNARAGRYAKARLPALALLVTMVLLLLVARDEGKSPSLVRLASKMLVLVVRLGRRVARLAWPTCHGNSSCGAGAPVVQKTVRSGSLQPATTAAAAAAANSPAMKASTSQPVLPERAKPGVGPMHFAYLVTGESLPGDKWRQLSQQKDVHVLFAAWRVRPNENAAAGYSQLFVFFYPSSTWSSTRNFLFAKATEVEDKLAVRFNYLMFVDDDVQLAHRSAASPTVFNTSNTIASFLLLQSKLEADQPPRASVEFRTHMTDVRSLPTTCAISCAFDGAMDIYHWSVAAYLLPYSLRFEKTSWPISQLIMNLRSQALGEGRCHLYRDVFINADTNLHSRYPNDYGLFSQAVALVKKCLGGRGLPLSQRAGESDDHALHRALRRPGAREVVAACAPKPRTVDYGVEIKGILDKWPVHCPF